MKVEEYKADGGYSGGYVPPVPRDSYGVPLEKKEKPPINPANPPINDEEAELLRKKELGTDRDVHVIVGVDAKLANGVFEIEKQDVKTEKDIAALSKDLQSKGITPQVNGIAPPVNGQQRPTSFVERTRKPSEIPIAR